MRRVAIVGSGPTGIGAATVLSDAGIGVDIVDPSAGDGDPAGHPDAAAADRAPGRPPRGLRTAFAGELPGTLLRKRINGSDFVFAGTEATIPLEGPWLPRSAARGGLANAWGAACYALRSEDYADWPLDHGELSRWFGPAMRLLHVSGAYDALSDAYPARHDLAEIGPANAFDAGSPFERLFTAWRDRGPDLARSGLHAGRARLAVRPRGSGRPDACQACGQCLEGCPHGAIWNGAAALDGLVQRGVRYLPDNLVRKWVARDGGVWLECGGASEPARQLGPYEAIFLAAGPLSSFRIAAQSVPGALPATARLAENDVTVIPFQLRDGLSHAALRFTLSEAAIALSPGGALERPAHLQLYRAGGASLGPVSDIIARLPSGLRALAERRISRLVVGMLYLHGAQSRGIRLCVADAASPIATLRATPETGDPGRAARREALDRLRRCGRLLGLTPLGFARRRGGPGFSAHLGCVLPIRETPGRLECHADGRLAGSGDCGGIYVVDLSALPAMPAQNPTLTGVANAMRVAARYAAARR